MKERLDVLLVKKGLAPSRQKAQIMLMEGIVFVEGQREDKAGSRFEETLTIEVRGKTLLYVSRGGLKLEKALEVFDCTPNQKICMDIGASTGGFTDCMLQNGAQRVYAIDVGYGQLDYKLRTDSRVVCMEKTNIRYVTKEDLPDVPSFGSVDVSFISLKLVLPVAKELLKEDGDMVCLIKPQFEAGKDKVGKRGVVSDPHIHEEVIVEILSFVQREGWQICGLSFSPIKGPEGNIEYLLHIKNKKFDHNHQEQYSKAMAKDVVKQAHQDL